MDFQKGLEESKKDIEYILERLNGADEKLNYLFFLRDEVNKHINKNKKELKIGRRI